MKYFSLLCCLAILAMVSCKNVTDLNNLDVTGNDAEFAIPLINTTASFNDLLENFDDNTFVEISPEGLVVLRYDGDVLTTTSEDIFAEVEAAIPPFIPVIDTVMPLPLTTPDGLDMDSIVMKTGTIQFYCESYHEEDISLTVRFPEIIKDQVPLTLTSQITHSGSPDQYLYPIAIPLEGYSLVSNDDGFFTIEYDAIRANGEPDTLTNFLLYLQDLTFSYAEGFLGGQDYEAGGDTIFIEFFEEYIKGDVWFEDPKVTFNVINSFGIPTRSKVNKFLVWTAEGEELDIWGEGIEEGIDFEYPALDEVGQTKTTTYVFSKDNSNIDTLLGSKPIAIEYDFDATTNPDNDMTIRGFMTDESQYVVNVDVELPLHGRAHQFLARDSFGVDLSNYDQVEEAEFKLITDNSVPLEVNMQLYLMDSNNETLDSLLMDDLKIIEAAPVDNEGLVTNSVEKVTFITVPGDRFDKMRAAQSIRMEASFSTTNDGTVPIKIINDQGVNVRMGMKLKLKD